jgi:hypothetical protein
MSVQRQCGSIGSCAFGRVWDARDDCADVVRSRVFGMSSATRKLSREHRFNCKRSGH